MQTSKAVLPLPLARAARAKKQRAKQSHRLIEAAKRLRAIGSLIETIEANPDLHKRLRKELLRGIPLSLVACVQNYFREAIRDLANSGAPFDMRARELNRVSKSLLEKAGLLPQEILFGDLLSEQVPLGNVRDILRPMSLILDLPLKRLIRNYDMKCVDCKHVSTAGDYLPNFWRTLNTLFRVRHALAHEHAHTVRFTLADVAKFALATEMLVRITDGFVFHELVLVGGRFDELTAYEKIGRVRM